MAHERPNRPVRLSCDFENAAGNIPNLKQHRSRKRGDEDDTDALTGRDIPQSNYGDREQNGRN